MINVEDFPPLLTVPEVQQLLRIGRGKAYDMIRCPTPSTVAGPVDSGPGIGRSRPFSVTTQACCGSGKLKSTTSRLPSTDPLSRHVNPTSDVFKMARGSINEPTATASRLFQKQTLRPWYSNPDGHAPTLTCLQVAPPSLVAISTSRHMAKPCSTSRKSGY